MTEAQDERAESPSIRVPSYHPHGEGGKVGVTPTIAAPADTVETPLTPVQHEPVAVRAARVRTDYESVKRIRARGVTVGQGKAAHVAHRTKRELVPGRQLGLLLERGDESLLLDHGLDGAVGHGCGNPRDKTLLRGLVGKVPTLEVLEILPARAHEREVARERSPRLHLGVNLHGIRDTVRPRLLAEPFHDLSGLRLRLATPLDDPGHGLFIREEKKELGSEAQQQLLEPRLQVGVRNNALRPFFQKLTARVGRVLLDPVNLAGRDPCGHRPSPYTGLVPPLPALLPGWGFTKTARTTPSLLFTFIRLSSRA